MWNPEVKSSKQILSHLENFGLTSIIVKKCYDYLNLAECSIY